MPKTLKITINLTKIAKYDIKILEYDYMRKRGFMVKPKYNYLKAANFLKALSHPTRLMIVNELALGKKCVNDIKDLVRVNQPNISQHLSLLKLNGIVDSRQNGKMKCYFLKDEEMVREIFSNLKRKKLI